MALIRPAPSPITDVNESSITVPVNANADTSLRGEDCPAETSYHVAIGLTLNTRGRGETRIPIITIPMVP